MNFGHKRWTESRESSLTGEGDEEGTFGIVGSWNDLFRSCSSVPGGDPRGQGVLRAQGT